MAITELERKRRRWRVQLALSNIQALVDELTDILEKDPKNGDINIGLQRLRRWKLGATKTLEQCVSPAEAEKLSKLDTPDRSYMFREDGQGRKHSVHLENEVESYRGFLVALAEHIEHDGEAALDDPAFQETPVQQQPEQASDPTRQTPSEHTTINVQGQGNTVVTQHGAHTATQTAHSAAAETIKSPGLLWRIFRWFLSAVIVALIVGVIGSLIATGLWPKLQPYWPW